MVGIFYYQKYLTMSILFIFLLVLLIFMFASILVLSDNYSYYSIVYKELPKKQFVRDRELIWERERIGRGNDVIYFVDTGSIKLADCHYIHNEIYTYFDLYSLYWLYKYNRYFKKKVLPYV